MSYIYKTRRMFCEWIIMFWFDRKEFGDSCWSNKWSQKSEPLQLYFIYRTLVLSSIPYWGLYAMRKYLWMKCSWRDTFVMLCYNIRCLNWDCRENLQQNIDNEAAIIFWAYFYYNMGLVLLSLISCVSSKGPILIFDSIEKRILSTSIY